jgi:hypothetical protein
MLSKGENLTFICFISCNASQLIIIYFQENMNSILNDLNKEIKEETEEEKIDIEDHFLPAISSCEEDQLARLVW